ncbi:MAG: FKBP-type peptidyl-prolyl cis-trans isomerase, partial [Desulfobacteraceae bacterium]|nr:FKBP-type peptidyl-prolyl cis-trans isomerase [Desulfobacteraceae bacterium]
NKKKEGVITLESGLQYKVIKKGNGEFPKPEDTIKCHYKGTTIDGVEFDSSYKRGNPAVFQLNRVIKGWTEALQLMKTGGKWEIFIPSDLAYGDRQAGPIEPGSTLIFEVEFISIENAKE